MRLAMVPEGTSMEASRPKSPAIRSSSSLTVGSSRKTSSPTSALAIASRMPAEGLVKVSDRKSSAAFSIDMIHRFGSSIPILGVCLGHQAIGEAFGSTVTYAPSVMHGKTSQVTHDGRTIFGGLGPEFEATRYHSLVLDPDTIPSEIEVSAQTEEGVIMGIRHKSLPIEGMQFHPESILTTEGARLIENWLRFYGRQDISAA